MSTALAWAGTLCQNTAPSQAEYRRRDEILFRSSSAVEQATVNRRVVGSNPCLRSQFGAALVLGAAPFASRSSEHGDGCPSQRKGRTGRPRVAFQGYFRVARYFSAIACTRAARAARSSAKSSSAARPRPCCPTIRVRDEVVLIRQFRAGSYAAGRHPWTWEIVAGIIEEGETAEDVVRREASKKRAGDPDSIPMYNVMLSPGACSETCTSFVGRVDATRPAASSGWSRRTRTSWSRPCRSPRRAPCSTATRSTTPWP